MTSAELAAIVRDYTARELAPVLAKNAALELRLLELETRPAPPPVVGPVGPAGAKGDPGVGVASVVISADGRWLAHLTDGRSVDAGPALRGEKGEVGPRGDIGPSGVQGPPGPVGPQGWVGAAGEPGMPGMAGDKGQPGRDGADGKDGAPGVNGKDGAPGLDGKDGHPGERGAQGEKGVDGLQGRDGRDGASGLPGAPGEKGADGRHGIDGVNGKDGLDGMGFDDFDLRFDETRGWILLLAQGERVKQWPINIPFDAKVWTAGTVYPKGAGTTWDGHYWIAMETTSDAPGEGSPSWRMAVRRGKQGRDGRQGKEGAPGRDLTSIDPATGRKW